MDQGHEWSDLEKLIPGPFDPAPIYDADADTLTLFISVDESFRERVDSLLTVYRSFATKAVVGCHIKGVMNIMKAVSAFDLGIHSGDVQIGLLLMGLPWTEVKGAGSEVFSRHYYEIVRPIAKTLGHQTIRIPELVNSH